MKKRKKIKALTVAGVVLLSLIVWIAWGNTALELNAYTIASVDLLDAFDGFCIAQVSDLHSYYVTGNHEARVEKYSDLKEGLLDLGVIVLEDARIEIEHSGDKLTLIGVDDPSFQTDYLFGDDITVMKSKLDELTDEKDGYTILLSHRPELFDTYVDSGVDLVFSGHAHGGQFRLPFIGGIAAPNQGLFPKYDEGIYTEGNTNMVVSRGVGNSIIPFRFNNRPEVILIELTTQGDMVE